MTTPKSAGTAMRWLEGKILYSVGFGVAVLLIIGAGMFYFTRASAHSTKVIRIGYGSGGPVRKHFLEQMALHGKARHLDIRLVETAGTDQTVSLIDQQVVDLGLITGAVEDQASRKFYQIAPLYMEPLQLLVKAPLYDSVSKDFGQLRGKSIGLDSPGSATNLVASELLSFIGLSDPETGKLEYQPVYIPQSEFMNLKRDAVLPDAFFQLGGIPSPSVRNLITNHDYRLVALPFGGSFNLDQFREGKPLAPVAGSHLQLDRAFVEESMIPAFTYSVLPAVPPADTKTIATRLILVGGEHLDDQVVGRLLELILSPEISGLVKPALNTELLTSNFEFDRHPGTDKDPNALKPIDVDSAFVAYGRIGEVWGLIITLYIGAAKLLRMWKERHVKDERASVGDFLLQVLAVEAEANASCTNALRIGLDQRLSDIKKTSIETHLAGRLEDPENLPSLLVTVADARTRIWGVVS